MFDFEFWKLKLEAKDKQASGDLQPNTLDFGKPLLKWHEKNSWFTTASSHKKQEQTFSWMFDFEFQKPKLEAKDKQASAELRPNILDFGRPLLKWQEEASWFTAASSHKKQVCVM